MPINPPGQIITFAQSSPLVTANLAVTGIKYRSFTKPFVRSEFMTEKLMSARETTNAQAIFETGADNVTFQTFTGCGTETSRTTVPDDAEFNNIYQRFDVQEWDIDGTDTLQADIDNLYAIRQTHAALLSKFDNHNAEVAGNSSIYFLLNTAQLETFSYLTTTTLSMSGKALGTSAINNILITEFDPEVTRAFKNGPDAGSPTTVIYRSFKLVVQQLTIVPQSQSTW